MSSLAQVQAANHITDKTIRNSGGNLHNHVLEAVVFALPIILQDILGLRNQT